MFEFLFGWRKASKCKKLIKTIRCRLKLLRSRRSCIMKQGREDIALLLKHGHHTIALKRVDYLIMDENMVQIYDLLDQFCEFILNNMRYIRRRRDCPNDINEAVSTLIFSSARFGDLPELLSIRKLFGERYGQGFVETALELQSGNLVNHQIITKLHMKSVPDEVKYRLLDEIAGGCVQQTGPLLIEYKPPNVIYDAGGTEGRNTCLNSLPELNNVPIDADCSEKFEFVSFDDHIEELVPNVSRDGIQPDRRIFIFRSTGIPLKKTSKIHDQQLVLQESYKLRAKTFPSERCKNGKSSFSHIHPKLPDYDELEAKFKELKREYLRDKQKMLDPRV